MRARCRTRTTHCSAVCCPLSIPQPYRKRRSCSISASREGPILAPNTNTSGPGTFPGSRQETSWPWLLDELAGRYGSLLSEDGAHGLPVFFLRWLPSNLLARFLRLSGDEVDLTRLFHWLGPAAHAGDWTYDPDLGREESQDIRRWLESRPSAWKTLLAMGLEGCSDRSECDQPYGFASCMHKEEHGRLFGAPRPSDFGLWCLDQAIVAEDANAAEWFLAEIAQCLHYGRFDEGLSRKVVSTRLAGYAGLQDEFDKRMAEFEALASDRSVSERRGHTRLRTERPDWHDHVKPHEGELRDNMASPALLHELAKVYFGGYLNVRGNSPRERLDTLLAGDVSLVEAVLFGFRKTIERDNLPSDRQIIRLGSSNRTHHLALPFMAGLEEIAKTAPSGPIDIDERLLRLALAVHYTVPMWPYRATSCGPSTALVRLLVIRPSRSRCRRAGAIRSLQTAQRRGSPCRPP